MNVFHTLQALVFTAACAFAVSATAGGPAKPAAPDANMQTVTITAKRMTAAEIAEYDREEARRKSKRLAAKNTPAASGKCGRNLG